MKKFFVYFIFYFLFVFIAAKYSPPFKLSSLEFHQSRVVIEPKGYVQTPLGGELDTSDLKRPTLLELGIHKQPIEESFIFAYWHNIGMYVVVQQIRSDKSARLKKTLLTYGEELPAGIELQHYLQLDNYSLGITYRGEVGGLKLFPCLEMTVLDFAYMFDSIVAGGDRHYRHLTLRSGIKSQMKFNKKNMIELFYMTSLPFADGLKITQSDIYFRHPTFQFEKQKLSLDYQDGQTLPNHISFEGEWIQ